MLFTTHHNYNDIIFDISKETDGWSGISETLDCHKEKVDRNKESINVKTITFTELLNISNAPLHIDYLSLDTEGSELEILKSLDHNKYTIGLMNIEHNFVEPRRSEIRNYLTNLGYEFIKEDFVDDWYKKIL